MSSGDDPWTRHASTWTSNLVSLVYSIVFLLAVTLSRQCISARQMRKATLEDESNVTFRRLTEALAWLSFVSFVVKDIWSIATNNKDGLSSTQHLIHRIPILLVGVQLTYMVFVTRQVDEFVRIKALSKVQRMRERSAEGDERRGDLDEKNETACIGWCKRVSVWHMTILLLPWTLTVAAMLLFVILMAVKTYDAMDWPYRGYIATLISWTVLGMWTLGVHCFRTQDQSRKELRRLDEVDASPFLAIRAFAFFLLMILVGRIGFYAYKHAVEEIHDQTVPGMAQVFDDMASRTLMDGMTLYFSIWMFFFAALKDHPNTSTTSRREQEEEEEDNEDPTTEPTPVSEASRSKTNTKKKKKKRKNKTTDNVVVEDREPEGTVELHEIKVPLLVPNDRPVVSVPPQRTRSPRKEKVRSNSRSRESISLDEAL
jgi:hypothetical protein